MNRIQKHFTRFPDRRQDFQDIVEQCRIERLVFDRFEFVPYSLQTDEDGGYFRRLGLQKSVFASIWVRNGYLSILYTCQAFDEIRDVDQ
jgi:hypothetical protein